VVALTWLLIDTEQQLDVALQQFLIVDVALASATEQLATTEKELATTKQVLAVTEQEFTDVRQRLATVEDRASVAEQELAATRQVLAVTEQELADARRRLATPLSTVSAVRNSAGKIALTFDDGPVRGWTDRYLRILEDHGIVATFFLTGRMAEIYPAGIRSILEAGHEVGNHSHTHRLLTNLSEEEVSWELSHSNQILFRHGGVVPTTFRPPFGGRNRQIDALVQEQGMRTIMWDVDPQDWRNPSAEEMVQDVLSRTRSGSIILFHEGRSNTLAALPPIIRKLQERGFQFVTVSALLQQGK